MCARRCSFWRTVLPQNHAVCQDPCCLLHPAQAETATQHVATRDPWSRNIPDSGLLVRQSQIIIPKRWAGAGGNQARRCCRSSLSPAELRLLVPGHRHGDVVGLRCTLAELLYAFQNSLEHIGGWLAAMSGRI